MCETLDSIFQHVRVPPTAYLRNTGAQSAEAGVGHVVEGTSQQGKFATVHFLSRVGFEHNVPNARVANCFVLACVHGHLREEKTRECGAVGKRPVHWRYDGGVGVLSAARPTLWPTLWATHTTTSNRNDAPEP